MILTPRTSEEGQRSLTALKNNQAFQNFIKYLEKELDEVYKRLSKSETYDGTVKLQGCALTLTDIIDKARATYN